VKKAYCEIGSFATEQQKELNRAFLPLVQSKMKEGYNSTANVAGGKRKFDRMKTALQAHTEQSVNSLFDDPSKKILESIAALVASIGTRIRQVAIGKTMQEVYSTLWDDQRNEAAHHNRSQPEKIHQCRDDMLYLNERHDGTMRSMGIALGESAESDATAVASAGVETYVKTKYKPVAQMNEVFNLCDSDTEQA
jgi:hypothetical protein